MLLPVYWLTLALLALYMVKRTFKKYKNMPRTRLDPKYRHIVRRDIGHWGRKDIIKGCFIHFPLSFSLLAIYTLILAAIVALQKRFACLDKAFHFYRRYFGRIMAHIYFNLDEKYDPWKETGTPVNIVNHIS